MIINLLKSQTEILAKRRFTNTLLLCIVIASSFTLVKLSDLLKLISTFRIGICNVRFKFTEKMIDKINRKGI